MGNWKPPPLHLDWIKSLARLEDGANGRNRTDTPCGIGFRSPIRLQLGLPSGGAASTPDRSRGGPERARELIEARPFKSWQDVERVPGFDGGMVDDRKSASRRWASP
jgi:hypothetical protein